MKTLTEQDYINAAKELNCEVAAKAVAEVESKGDGFLSTDEPKILYERHIFYKYTKGKFSQTNSDLCNKTPGGYGKESEQHAKLTRASKLDKTAALMSCSWGKFQIMGFHWEKLGYKTLQEFINKMYDSETEHLDAFVRYIKTFGLQQSIQTKNWAKFAQLYNGKDYAKNNYDTKLANAYKRFTLTPNKP